MDLPTTDGLAALNNGTAGLRSSLKPAVLVNFLLNGDLPQHDGTAVTCKM